jgi:hypothetical protein
MGNGKQWMLMALVTALVVSFSSAGLASPIGYAVQSNGNDHLYQIDLGTGAYTDLGLVNFVDAEGLAFAGNSLYAIGGSVSEFWNITTPPGFKVGDTGSRNGIDAGMDYNRLTGIMYNINGGGGSDLYTVNLATGAATSVGSSSFFADGLGINSKGEAFAADWIFSDSLYSVNLSTGALTLVGSLGLGDVSQQSGLSFDQFDILWALTDDGRIYTLNTSTGAATFVANTITACEGLAINTVPLPPTVLLLGSGLLGLAGWRRFRKS